jgi:hypothetical protein
MSDQDSTTTTAPAKDTELEIERIRKAFYLSVIGLCLAAVLAMALVFAGQSGSDVTGIVGLFTSVLGTLVGAFFGLQIGASGKEKAEQQADDAKKEADHAQKKASALEALVTPDKLAKVKKKFPHLF